MRRRIGIDVGGTNTDAVLLEEDAVAAAVKTPTTADVTTGITRALAALVEQAPAAREAQAAMIGTTHFTNAVVQRRDLGRVAAVRIGLPSGASLPPFVDWPEDLAGLVRAEVVTLEGGHEFDGRPLVPFDAKGMREAARRIRAAGIRSVGVAAVFSPLNASCEEEAGAILANHQSPIRRRRLLSEPEIAQRAKQYHRARQADAEVRQCADENLLEVGHVALDVLAVGREV